MRNFSCVSSLVFAALLSSAWGAVVSTDLSTPNTLAGRVGIGTTLPAAALDVATTGTAASAIIVPRDTTANRPTTPVNGMLRYASDLSNLEAYQNGSLRNLISGITGTAGYVPQFTSSTALGNSPIAVSGSSVGIGTATPTSTLQVAGAISATNVNAAPVVSTRSLTSRFSTSTTGNSYTGESITITVPSGPPRYYRISLRQLAQHSADNVAMQFTLSTSSSSVTGTPTGMGSPYFISVANHWYTFNSEGFVQLSPGTYTYYVIGYNGGTGTLTVANSTSSDQDIYCNVIAWPM